MVNFELKARYGVYDLEKLIALLRSDEGCPWDREQTHESIRRNFLEEAYEAVEAIDEKDAEHLKEELGDVLVQVLFHSRIEEEAGSFNLDDVADAVCRKLIYRHPHVFGDVQVSGSEQVIINWDKLKKHEKNQDTVGSEMDMVAKSLPALWRAEKIQAKAAKTGFDWTDITGAMEKLEEEINELKSAIAGNGDMEEELGDLLFTAVNIARFIGCDPEEALHRSSEKFVRRFKKLEERIGKLGKKLTDMTLAEMDKLYNEEKQH